VTFESLCDSAQRIANSYSLPGDISRLTGVPAHRIEEILRDQMINPVDDKCGECKEPVPLTARQQIFWYPNPSGKVVVANRKKVAADSPGVWKRVCGTCLNQLRPQAC
jgi:hypothetical protein